MCGAVLNQRFRAEGGLQKPSPPELQADCRHSRRSWFDGSEKVLKVRTGVSSA